MRYAASWGAPYQNFEAIDALDRRKTLISTIWWFCIWPWNMTGCACLGKVKKKLHTCIFQCKFTKIINEAHIIFILPNWFWELDPRHKNNTSAKRKLVRDEHHEDPMLAHQASTSIRPCYWQCADSLVMERFTELLLSNSSHLSDTWKIKL
jgi:hypothetical protein